MSTLSKMSALDSIKVKVQEDGDVELTKVNEENILNNALYFGISEVADGGLDSELISYGCEADRVKEAIDEVLTSEYNETIKV
jgi:hypothetical protein